MTGPQPKSDRAPRWLLLAGLAAVLGAAFLGLWLAMGDQEDTVGPVRGLQLGYATSMARARFAPEAEGSFRTEVMGEDLALIWTPAEPGGGISTARMEFHLGLLVAVRLTLRPDHPDAEGPQIAVSDVSVLTREPTSEGVELTWLARTCPTHAEEVQRRISQRPGSD